MLRTSLTSNVSGSLNRRYNVWSSSNVSSPETEAVLDSLVLSAIAVAPPSVVSSFAVSAVSFLEVLAVIPPTVIIKIRNAAKNFILLFLIVTLLLYSYYPYYLGMILRYISTLIMILQC